ncbi:hypothetical protein CCACVL1_02796 [Corchorus capsularis]|uniref:Uncharacterized protein n=1 Tax=Corchorus capsularis TaxID=210143 RepID=A0A1R3K604_COCAP|nr:hypothetical protein CCACVL1_02796 [Corchorus capsularis]
MARISVFSDPNRSSDEGLVWWLVVVASRELQWDLGL